MTKILITGGAGFIGSRVTKKLLEDKNIQIVCIDNFDAFYSRQVKERNIVAFLNNKNYFFFEGDIRNNADLDILPDVDIIIHLAAKAGVRQSIDNPIIYHDVNVAGTNILLEFAKRRKIKQFIFASSSSVYGISKNIPWKEDEKLFPISPYACSKLSDEMLGHVYAHLNDIRFLSLRFFTVYGPGQRPDLAIYKFFKLISDGLPISLYGNGQTKRDYTYIDDVVNAVCSALNYKSSNYEIINVGCNNPISLSDLIALIETICNKKAKIDYYPNQPGDVPYTYADISKAECLLDYRPTIDIVTGLKSFYEWFKLSQNQIPVFENQCK